MTSGASGEPLVTVVVVNFNGASLLPACLGSLAAQDLPRNTFEVWVVDNASSDASLDVLRRDYPWVRVIENPVNAGFAGGNNAALRLVRSRFAALLNNDAVASPDWLRRMLAPFEQDARTGATTAKIVFLPRFWPLTMSTQGFVAGGGDTRELGVRVHALEVDGVDAFDDALFDDAGYAQEGHGASRFRWTRPEGTLLIPVPEAGPFTVRLRVDAPAAKPLTLGWAGGRETVEAAPRPMDVTLTLLADARRVDVVNNAGGYVSADGFGGDRGFKQVDDGRFDVAEEVFTACGAAVCFRTDALHEAGYFDDAFFLYYEDTDLSWRLRRRGWTIRYEPAALVRHVHSATSTEWSPLFTFHVERNRLLMLTKNATAARIRRALRRYLAETSRLAAGMMRHPRARRSEGARLRLRGRVIASYVRHLPGALRERRRIDASAAVGRAEVEAWLGR